MSKNWIQLATKSFFYALGITLPLSLIFGFAFAHLMAPEPFLWGYFFKTSLLSFVVIWAVVFWQNYQVGRVAEHIRYLARTRDLGKAAPEKPGLVYPVIEAVNELNHSWSEVTVQLRSFVAALETIIESIPDPLLMIDANRRIARSNISARNLFGPNIQGRDLAAVLKNPMVLEAANYVIGGHSGRVIEMTVPFPMEREFRVRIEPILSKTADGTRVILSLHDMTAMKRSEKTMADFIANASHELKTPLSALIGFVETMQGPAKDDKPAQENFLRIMHEQATRMTRLVQDLLSLSRVEMEEHSVPQTIVNLPEIVEDTVLTLQHKAEQKGCKIKLKIDENLPHIVGDHDQVTQVVYNLIDNAIKYGAENAEVKVILEETLQKPLTFPSWDHEVVCFQVIDQGEGIPRDHISRLTERFYRVNPGKSKKIGGTGLGLAIVKHIINRHRGALTIESEVGKGSVFSVYFRAVVDESALVKGLGESVNN